MKIRYIILAGFAAMVLLPGLPSNATRELALAMTCGAYHPEHPTACAYVGRVALFYNDLFGFISKGGK